MHGRKIIFIDVLSKLRNVFKSWLWYPTDIVKLHTTQDENKGCFILQF